MNDDARRHLLRLLDIARHGPPELAERDDWLRGTLGRFGATLEALRAVKAITQEELDDWNNRMLVALGLEPLPPMPPPPPGVFRNRLISLPGRVPHQPITPPPPARFLRLVPATVPDIEVGHGGRFQVLGIELYDTKVAVAWRLAPMPDPEQYLATELAVHDRDSEGLPEEERKMLRAQFVQHASFRRQIIGLSDDVGTVYHHGGGGSGGGRDERVGRAQFHPAVPNSATVLTVTWDAFTVAVDLGHG